jgi:chemotaxis response regulator CheB
MSNREGVGIVVISGSAGALSALYEILEWLPVNMPAPVVVVLHHGPGHSDIVARLLQKHCRLLVTPVAPGVVMRPGFVYLAPSTEHMWLTDDHRIACGDHRRINFLRSSSEPLLDSVTALFGSGGLAVVLSGMGRNGAAAAKRLHDAGGTVLVQDRATSAHFAMPQAAIEARAATQVLPLPMIGPAILRLSGVKVAAKAV